MQSSTCGSPTPSAVVDSSSINAEPITSSISRTNDPKLVEIEEIDLSDNEDDVIHLNDASKVPIASPLRLSSPSNHQHSSLYHTADAVPEIDFSDEEINRFDIINRNNHKRRIDELSEVSFSPPKLMRLASSSSETSDSISSSPLTTLRISISADAPVNVVINDSNYYCSKNISSNKYNSSSKARCDNDYHSSIISSLNNASLSLSKPFGERIYVSTRCCGVESNGKICKVITHLGNKCHYHLMKEDNLIIRASTLGEQAGHGLFAGAKGYDKGERIIEYAGDRVSSDKGGLYVLALSKYSIDAHKSCYVGGFANCARRSDISAGRAKGNNAHFVISGSKNKVPILRSTKKIQPYEEIFCSYGNSYWSGHR
jgi:hypothetical protein